MEKQIIERFGGLLKKEPMTCVEKDIILKGTCILESTSPFSGYYWEVGGNAPLYLYLMLEGSNTYWKVARAVQEVKKKISFPFDGVFAEITFPDGFCCYAIRIRDLERYDQISALQQAFQEAGLELKKKQRHIEGVESLIRLEKFFYLEPHPDGYYIDKQQPHHGYFTLPGPISWEAFSKLTKEAKYDTSILYFDQALAYFYENGKMVDLVRIYREQLSMEILAAIRNRYFSLMNA